jgi:aquaporin Z
MTAQPHQADLDLDAVEQPAPQPSLLPRVAAELFGTFALVTAIIVTAAFGTLGASATPLHVALAGGLALTAMVVAFGSVSGAHLNPAVSLGAAIAGRLSWADLVPYIVAQTLGGVAAGGLLRVITPSTLPAALGLETPRSFISGTANGFGTHSPIAALSQGQVTFSTAQALVIEAVAAAVLVGVVLAVTRRANAGAPLAIGATYAVGILVAAQVTNAGINPARATGTALFAEPWAVQQLWLFWVAPLLGGVIAGLVVLMIQRASDPVVAWDEDEDDDDWDDDEDEDVEVTHSAATALPVEIEPGEGTEVEPLDPPNGEQSEDEPREGDREDEDGEEFIADERRS